MAPPKIPEPTPPKYVDGDQRPCIARGASEWAVLVLVSVPVVGFLMGGILSVPLEWLTRGRDPQFTLGLCLALGLSILLIGKLLHFPTDMMLIEWLSLITLVLIRRAFGSLHKHLESFGVIHALLVPLTLVTFGVLRARGVH